MCILSNIQRRGNIIAPKPLTLIKRSRHVGTHFYTPVSYIYKAVRHNITHILYKVAIKLQNSNHIYHTPTSLSATRRVKLEDQEQLILPDCSVAQSLVFCEVFCRSLFVILLQITASDYPFGTFKLD